MVSVYRRKLTNTHEMAYAADKYVNPYENYHSVGEVIDWFNKNDIAYIGFTSAYRGRVTSSFFPVEMAARKARIFYNI